MSFQTNISQLPISRHELPRTLMLQISADCPPMGSEIKETRTSRTT